MPFPTDNYTPYGYLDTPGHTRHLSPQGVLRSWDAGFRWHFPAHAGMYGGRRETYRAGFRIGIDGAVQLSDIDRASSPYHSKHLFTFDLSRGDASVQVTYHLVGDHALRAIITARQVSRIAVYAEYQRLIAAHGEWGESGLVGRVEHGMLILQGFEDGDAFVLWASQPVADLGISPQAAIAETWVATHGPGLPGEGFVTTVGRRGDSVALYSVLGFSHPVDGQIEIIMARGKTVAEAQRRLHHARRVAAADQAYKLAEDDVFWARAPQLDGDWPDHWRRGLVYDMETLRMMVKQPIGMYQNIWDAMQIQAPRVVLAETAIDALLLSYADPQLAQELILGTFLDAPEPNIPCTREDGTYNMVAADGTICGTAPSWGYPWLVLAWLDALQPNQVWLEQLYPRLAEYLDWWLTYRRDADGWLFYACSWESGQDDSPRFGDQPLGGGHPIRHIRPVDLHAAFAHAAMVMARFATALERTYDIAKWTELAADFRKRIHQLWVHSDGTSPVFAPRFADFDRNTGQFTNIDDLMLLAPVALDIAPKELIVASRGTIKAINPDTLTWPVPTWTVIAAALTAEMGDTAAELAAAVCDRVYRFWDAREAHPERTLPGISCEYWPVSGRCGGEGYGWGTFAVHLVLHVLVGISPTREHLHMRPNVPKTWRVPGRLYRVRAHLRRPITITLEPLSQHHLSVTVNQQREEIEWGEELTFSWEI